MQVPNYQKKILAGSVLTAKTRTFILEIVKDSNEMLTSKSTNCFTLNNFFSIWNQFEWNDESISQSHNYEFLVSFANS